MGSVAIGVKYTMGREEESRTPVAGARLTDPFAVHWFQGSPDRTHVLDLLDANRWTLSHGKVWMNLGEVFYV